MVSLEFLNFYKIIDLILSIFLSNAQSGKYVVKLLG